MTTIALITIMTLVFYTFAGFQDDYIKIKDKGNDGLTARQNYLDKLLSHFYQPYSW